MKKLISSLVLVLVLCLACSIAFADSASITKDIGNDTHTFNVTDDTSSETMTVVDWPVENATTLEIGLVRFRCIDHDNADYSEVVNQTEFLEYPIWAEHDFWDVATAKEKGLDKDGKVIKDNKYVTEYKAETCTEDGYIVVYCKHYAECKDGENYLKYDASKNRFTGHQGICKATKKIVIPATGHKWSDDPDNAALIPEGDGMYHTVVSPTCAAEGELVAYCLNKGCKETKLVTDNAKAYHEWEPYEEIVTAPNCQNWGEKAIGKKCSKCEKIVIEKYEDLMPVPDAHVWGDWLVEKEKAATCTEAGYKYEYRLCKVCAEYADYLKDVDPSEWANLEVAKQVRETKFDALGHLKVDDKQNTKKTVKAATCTTPEEYEVICGRCGKAIPTGEKDKDGKDVTVRKGDKLDPNNHPVKSSEKVGDPQKADCVLPAGQAYHCNACGQDWFDETAPALGHELKLVYSYAGYCDEEQVRHDLENETTYTHAKEYYKCTRKGCIYGVAAEDLDPYMSEEAKAKVGETLIVKVVDNDSPEHIYSDWIERNPPRAGENPGYWIRQCTVCGDLDEYKSYTAPTVCFERGYHNFGYEVITPATLTETGVGRRFCEDCGYSDTYVIAKLSEYTDAEKFVARCYDKILGRVATAAEVMDWSNKLESGEATAADIVAGFIGSDEFAKSDKDVVETLYEAMLNRGSDLAGYVDWSSRKEFGVSDGYLVNGFAGSKEFAELCDEYGIEAGKADTEVRDNNIHATGFVNRCYKVALNRAGEPDGLNYWVENMISGAKDPKEIAYGFVFSKEYDAATKIASEQSCDLVEDLYRLYLGREGSEEEVLWYANLITDGMTLEELNTMFANSPEFADIIASFGL